MKIVLIIAGIGLFLYLFSIMRKGNIPFWNKVRKNPDLALELFSQDEKNWLVEPPAGKSINSEEWEGPFRLAVPSLDGRIIKIYGKVGKYKKSQKEIVGKL